MPNMYSNGEYDLAGFAVGAVEKNNLLPCIDRITEKDIVIGLPSSGIHSNGFSLVRKVLEIGNVKYTDIAPFSETGRTIGIYLMRLNYLRFINKIWNLFNKFINVCMYTSFYTNWL